MSKNRCFIVGAGTFSGMSVRPGENDLIIAADGGYTYLKEIGIEPHILMGDFDSLKMVPEYHRLVRHSPLKDDTDMALAVAYAVEKGYDTFFLYGGLGGRLDHTLANLQLLNGMSRQGLEAYLIGEGVIITSVTSEQIVFSGNARGIISVFCLGDPATGVCERGLKYGLEDAVLTCDRALGISNEFIGRESSISSDSGTLLILWNESNGLPKRRCPMGNVHTDASALVSELGWRTMHEEGESMLQSDKLTDNGEEELR